MSEDRMNYERLYEYRFRDVDQPARAEVWRPIAMHVWREMGEPQRLLDPAAGRGEFIDSVPAGERWAVDLVEYHQVSAAHGVNWIVADVFDAELPGGFFEGVFVSNFLEHLPTQEAAAAFLERIREVIAPGGRIAIMGPNYRYAHRHYWDYADHRLALTHLAVEEHLFAAGFEPTKVISRFLPYSFNGRLPPSRRLTDLYLRCPPLWRLLGKQFLVVAQRPTSG
jgi:SAM-dependent methyltransferase